MCATGVTIEAGSTKGAGGGEVELNRIAGEVGEVGDVLYGEGGVR